MAKYLKINVVNAGAPATAGERIVPIDNVASVDYTSAVSYTHLTLPTKA